MSVSSEDISKDIKKREALEEERLIKSAQAKKKLDAYKQKATKAEALLANSVYLYDKRSGNIVGKSLPDQQLPEGIVSTNANTKKALGEWVKDKSLANLTAAKFTEEQAEAIFSVVKLLYKK